MCRLSVFCESCLGFVRPTLLERDGTVFSREMGGKVIRSMDAMGKANGVHLSPAVARFGGDVQTNSSPAATLST